MESFYFSIFISSTIIMIISCLPYDYHNFAVSIFTAFCLFSQLMSWIIHYWLAWMKNARN